jgi:hypothetical protein
MARLEEDQDNEDNENDPEQPPRPPVRPHLAIQDESEWFRQYGLSGEPHYGDESYTNQQEATQRVQEQANYQAQVHERLFQDETTSSTGTGTKQQQDQQAQKRTQQLQAWAKETIQILTAADPSADTTTSTISSPASPAASIPISYNLKDLASHSDTVFAMAENRPHFQQAQSEEEEAKNGSSSLLLLRLNLQDYSKDAVEAFLRLLQSSTDNITEDYSLHMDSTDGYIIESCQLAHYLQCTELLDCLVHQILIRSVDSANCMSLAQLADQLHLPALLEASLNHMMRSLGCLEEHEIWGDLTPELQERIRVIQQLLQSSVNQSRGGQRQKLYFSSFAEYLAMFAEQVDYYLERLTEAKLQQDQKQQEQRHTTPAWEYAQTKIDQQQERVRILKVVLAEQKKLFSQKS